MSGSVQSVERAFSILSAFAADRNSLSVIEIAAETGLPRATAYRLLHTLQGLGLVRAVEGRYELTHRVLELGAGYAGPSGISGISQPVLDRLSLTFGEHTALGLLDGDHVVAVAVASAMRSRLLSVAIQVGQRLPAETTAMGRILLAEAGGLGKFGVQIRKNGFVIVNGSLEPGLRAIAVPVSDRQGTVVASISVACNAGRATLADLRKKFLPQMVASAQELTSLT